MSFVNKYIVLELYRNLWIYAIAIYMRIYTNSFLIFPSLSGNLFYKLKFGNNMIKIDYFKQSIKLEMNLFNNSFMFSYFWFPILFILREIKLAYSNNEKILDGEILFIIFIYIVNTDWHKRDISSRMHILRYFFLSRLSK